MERANVRPGSTRTRILVSAICLSLSALSVFPFFVLSQSPSGGASLWMPVTHDMILHFDQMKSFHNGLAAGEAYPRWEEDTNRGFGAPTTSYYPPGVYYLTSAVYAIAQDWIWTLLLAHFVMMVASGFAIYAYARRFMDVRAALIAMAAYIFLPYHTFDQYQRGALAELLVFAFMPLMLLFAERLFDDKTRSAQTSASETLEGQGERQTFVSRRASQTLLNLAGLGVTLAAFLWCHPPTAYQFMLSFALFVTLLAWRSGFWKGIIKTAFGILLGLSLSAAYIYPAFVEQHLIHREFITKTWPYNLTYIFAGESGYDLVEFIWMFNLAAVVIGAGVLLFLERLSLQASPTLRERIWLWLAVGCFASFMMTQASHPLTGLIPKIDIGVFAWRMLGITTLLAALFTGACAQAATNASKERTSPGHNSIASLVFVAILAGALLVSGRIMLSIYGASGFTTAEEHVNLAMMPAAGPVEPLELPKVERAQLASGADTVEVESWKPEHRVLRVDLSGPDKLLIRTFNFPGWLATVNGESVPIISGQGLRVELPDTGQAIIRDPTINGEPPSVDGQAVRVIGSEPLGDIVIELSPGVNRVVLEYANTPARRVGSLISIASLLLVISLTISSWLMGLRAK